MKACKASACGGSVDTVAFSYDGEGHRTKIVATPAAGSPVTTTDFRYHGNAVVAEVVNGTVTREFVTNDAGTIQKVVVPSGQTDAGTYLVVWNGHGDATGLWRMNADGTLTLANSFTYGTWGAPTTSTHNSISNLGFRYLYVGAFDVQWDDAFGLGLHYMHARHYHPALGRFLQPDPARAEANGYGYAANEPISRVDPRGEASGIVFGSCGWLRIWISPAGSRGYASIWGEGRSWCGVLTNVGWTISWFNFNRSAGSSRSGGNLQLSDYWKSPIFYPWTGSGRVGVVISSWWASLIYGGWVHGRIPYAETWIF